MDRNREGRRSIMAASANGSSRRRHRTSSLRESADEDGPMELPERTRFRDRGVKKDRDRDRSNRSKKRREDRSMQESNIDDSSEESSSGDDQDDDEDGGGGSAPMHQSVFHHQVRDRESFNEASRPATTWRPANELIGFSVPRKARSASTKRSHENWVSGNGVGGEQSNRHSSASPSPVRPAVPSPVSPTSSTASLRKKMVNKLNGTKQRPPKSSAKASSPKPEEELEIEIAEVLYGLRAQSQGSSKKDSVANIDMREVDGSKSAGKSGVPSSLSDSASTAPENRVPSSGPLSIIAPKRKRPRQVIEDLGSPVVAQSFISSIPDVKKNIEPGLEKQLGSEADNEGIPHDFMGSRVAEPLPEPAILDVAGSVNEAFKPVSEDSRDIRDVGQGMGEEFPKQEQIVAVVTPHGDCDAATATLANSMKSEMGSQREDGFEIDLMAPPPLSKSSPEREDYNGEDRGGDEAENHRDKKKAKVMTDVVEQDKAVLSEDIETSLQLDLGKHERDAGPRNGGEKLQQDKSVKDEHSVAETTVQCSSLPVPVSLAGWPKGFPPIGYVAPMQGAAPVSGNAVPPSLVQPLISQPRSKRCATHCHIARSIHCQQQMMKMNPFWPGAAQPIFGSKSCNVNILQSGELQRSSNSVPDKNQALTVIPGDNGRDKGGQSPNLADSIRKQQILFQHALPAGASPNGVVPVPTFVFPVNHQSVAAAGASVQSGSVNTSNPIPVSGSATASPSVSFNYPNIPSNNTHQYLAILQNNPYPYPMPASGAPSAFGGVAHAQHIPYFNGSFYPSQLIHPLQIQQQQQPSTKLLQHQQGNQNTSISSGSSTPQMQQQKQQQQQSRSHLIPASHQVRRLDIEAGGEDSPSTADSHVSRSPMFAQNFAANYSLVAPSLPNGANHSGEKKPQQQPQQGMKQPFTVSFAGMNGADISSVSEAARNGYHHQIMVAAASAQAAQQKKNSRLSEEGKSEGNESSSNVNENKKSTMGKASESAAQSIAFSHSAMTGPGTVNGSNSQFQAQLQFQQQQMLQFQQQLQQHQQQQQQFQQQYQQQLQQQQQHLVAARNKSLATSNGSTRNDHLASSSPGIAKFPGIQSAASQNFGQSSSPTQSPRWKSSATTMTSEAASPLASATLKTHSQSQVRAHQNPTQISFVANQKSSPTPQGHQAPSNHPSQTSPIVVGSPSNSLSKDGGGSPKATSFSSCGNRAGQPSTITSQRSRNSSPVGSSRNTPILGNPHIFPSNSAATRPQMQQQSQLQKHQVQQAQLMFSNAYLQAQQASQPNAMNSAAAAASSYYMQRWRPEQQQQFVHPQGSTMSTSDVKAVISSAASNVKAGGLTSQGTGTSPLLAPPGFSFHAVPAAVQVIQKEHKPAA